jgi:hypothetical protein
MIFSPSNKYQQEADTLVVETIAVLRAIRYHDDNCSKRNCCVLKIIKQIGFEATNPKATNSYFAPPLRHRENDNPNDSY